MSVTYIYAIDSAGDLTSASTNSTSGNTLDTNELLWVTSGSTVSGATLQVSSVSVTGSGTAVTNPGGSTWAYNGGSITAQGQHITQPLTGGAALVDNGATLTQATVYGGAGVLVLSGGTTNGTLLSGGFESIVSGGTASNTVTDGGNENIYAGASATSTAIKSGGQEIYTGGTAISAGIGAGGIQDVWSGGTANNTTINGGGLEVVHAGGGSFASDNIAGEAQIYGFDLSGTVIDTGVMEVMSGGTAQSSYLISGGTQVISAGGVGKGVNLEILGTQTVMSGGTAYNTFLTGGTLNVQSGGIASIPVMSSGEIVVSAGGAVDGANGTGGTIEVLSGGTAHASILAGAQQILMGGTASGTHILSGGSEVVVSGSSVAPIVYAGGSETVYSGATLQNVEISGAGTLSVESGANVVGDILFGPAGGRLQLIGATLPAIKIDGLAVGDTIDLNNIAGGNSATYANGTLTIANTSSASIGTVLATLSLGTAPDGAFTVGSDGHGGTLITITAYTVAQIAAAEAPNGNGLPGGAVVVDSAANVSTNIDLLQKVAFAQELTSVTLTDSGTPALSMTAAQFAADGKAIAAITGNFVLDVTASSSATITGLAAHATVVEFSGASTSYSVAAGNGTITVSNSGQTDTITGVTALQFSNATEIVATASHPGTTLSSLNVAELYSAALNRAPDVAGLKYYENTISANPTLSGVTLGEYFLSSSEYTSAHNYAQSSAGDTQFINDLYTNVLHRSGSSSEVSFYQGVINGFLSGQTAGTAGYSAAELQAHAQVLQYFSASAEFLSDIQITAQNPASASHWLLLI